MKKLLIVDDDTDLCHLLNLYLSRKGFQVTTVFEGGQALNHIEADQPDLVICDIRLGDMDGVDLLRKAKQFNPEILFVFITAYDDIKTSVMALRAGAVNYITKPLLPEEIAKAVDQALEKYGTKKSKAIVSDMKEEIPEFVCSNTDSFNKLLKQVELIAPTNYSVILHGDSGTGKQTIAREIHKRSKRSDKPFVIFNHNAIADNLSEQELREQIGLCLEQANGGTLFINELTAVPHHVQLHLLNYIKEKKLIRPGAAGEVELDVRCLAASSENLWYATNNGKLPQDLYLRLNDFIIEVLPLHNRKDDIVYFANYFLASANKEMEKDVKGFTPEVEIIFKNYVWKDNLRELKNMINKAVLRCQTGLINAASLPTEIYLAAKNELSLNKQTSQAFN
jgi:two-component system response regulator HydG